MVVVQDAGAGRGGARQGQAGQDGAGRGRAGLGGAGGRDGHRSNSLFAEK